MMNKLITGLHHITALASDPQRNFDFYAGFGLTTGEKDD